MKLEIKDIHDHTRAPLVIHDNFIRQDYFLIGKIFANDRLFIIYNDPKTGNYIEELKGSFSTSSNLFIPIEQVYKVEKDDEFNQLLSTAHKHNILPYPKEKNGRT